MTFRIIIQSNHTFAGADEKAGAAVGHVREVQVANGTSVAAKCRIAEHIKNFSGRFLN